MQKGMRIMDEMDSQKSNRILYLYSELLDDKMIKKSEAARRFHVTEKSIQRELTGNHLKMQTTLFQRYTALTGLKNCIFWRNGSGYLMRIGLRKASSVNGFNLCTAGN